MRKNDGCYSKNRSVRRRIRSHLCRFGRIGQFRSRQSPCFRRLLPTGLLPLSGPGAQGFDHDLLVRRLHLHDDASDPLSARHLLRRTTSNHMAFGHLWSSHCNALLAVLRLQGGGRCHAPRARDCPRLRARRGIIRQLLSGRRLKAQVLAVRFPFRWRQPVQTARS